MADIYPRHKQEDHVGLEIKADYFTGTLNGTASGGAPLDSPALTGTPTAPTAAVGTNTTQLATTAFVQSATKNKTQTVALVALGTSGTSTVAQIETAVNAIIAALKA